MEHGKLSRLFVRSISTCLSGAQPENQAFHQSPTILQGWSLFEVAQLTAIVPSAPLLRDMLPSRSEILAAQLGQSSKYEAWG
mmetsp:Transcript_147879/g.473379  ORF Transcript_147879/g.473379 Transcript_147879/m.473379 type:complete len:82 (+) Transcript_147879:1157-1402(+)